VLVKYHPAAAAKATVIPAPPLIRVEPDPDGCARRRARAGLGYSDEHFVLVYFGYLYPEKGVETVLEAARLARPALPGLRLLIVGGTPANLASRDPTYAQRLLTQARESGLWDCTHWTGHCDEAAVQDYLRAGDAGLLPFVEGVRLNNSSFAVAAALGLPVVTTRGAELEPEFRHRENVLLVPPGDAPAAAAAVAELASSPSLREALCRGSVEFSRGRCSLPAIVAETLRVLFPSPRPATREPATRGGVR
jgi:glycosyltransferase involved in cell wall biosynthesis